MTAQLRALSLAAASLASGCVSQAAPKATAGVQAEGGARSPAQLLRRKYESSAEKGERGYLLYLPAGYEPEGGEKWPVLLFLHGNGERGAG